MLVFLNMFIYTLLLLNIFLIFFIIDYRNLKTLSDFRFFKNFSFLYNSFIIVILSMAGIPPLSGFLGKFLVFIYIFYKNNFIMFYFFFFTNLFFIYFYVQNLRFLVSKTNNNIFFLKNYKFFFNYNLIKFINIINFINIFLIFYFEEMLILFHFFFIVM